MEPSTGSLSVIERGVLVRCRDLDLPPGTPVLDVPCGAGDLTAALLGLGLDVHAADLDEGAADLGARFARVDLDREPLPWSDGRFRLVCALEGIEHLENPKRYLRELFRVLAPGGTLILTTPNVVSLRSRVRFFGSGFFHTDRLPLDESRPDPLHHIALQTFPMLRYHLHTAGFEILEVAGTHIKPVSWLYLIFVPWMWLYTKVAFRREKRPSERARNRSVGRTLFSKDVLLAENLMLVARRGES